MAAEKRSASDEAVPHTGSTSSRPLSPTDHGPRRPAPPSSIASAPAIVVRREDENEKSDSLISRLLISPMIFISFLLSLALVDRQNRDYRAQRAVPTTRLGRFWRLVCSPWHDTKAYVQSGRVSNSARPDGQGEPWLSKGMHRKMVKVQVIEAFELRNTLVVVMVIAGVIIAWGVGKALWTVYGKFNGV